jgi:hypothetical protein
LDLGLGRRLTLNFWRAKRQIEGCNWLAGWQGNGGFTARLSFLSSVSLPLLLLLLLLLVERGAWELGGA